MAQKPSKNRGKKRAARQRRERKRSLQRLALPILAVVLIGTTGVWWVTRQPAAQEPVAVVETVAREAGDAVELAPASLLSSRVKAAAPVVQEAYRFAIANPDVLSSVPCYCGCGGVGHGSNLDCFIDRVEPDGSVTFDYHAVA